MKPDMVNSRPGKLPAHKKKQFPQTMSEIARQIETDLDAVLGNTAIGGVHLSSTFAPL